MLLFTDGFEYFCPEQIWTKWNVPIVFNTGFQIVQGMDNSKNPPIPFARKPDGRALYVNGGGADLMTHIRKSRTVFMGFGVKPEYYNSSNRNYNKRFSRICVDFYTKTMPGWEIKDVHASLLKHIRVATCEMVINGSPNNAQTSVSVKWSFPSANVPDVFIVLDPNTNLYNGDWHFFQLGFTLHGNNPDGATAWVENRIGSNTAVRKENVFTADPDDENSYYMNGVALECQDKYTYDDVYICNDEGSVNNSFLNPIYIRSTLPVQQGNKNNAVGINTSEVDRAQAVNSEMVGTEQLPNPLPLPEEDQHFVEWENPRGTYLRLPNINSEQTFNFRNINFAGSNPQFLGAVSYMMCRPGFYDCGQTGLEPTMYSGLTKIPITTPLRKPLTYMKDNEWEVRRGIFENQSLAKDQNFEDPIFNRDGIQNVEFGIKVIRHDDHPEAYLPGHLRLKYTIDVLIEEVLTLKAVASRHIEEVLNVAFNFSSNAEYDRTFAIYDELEFSEAGSDGARGIIKYINSVLYVKDNIPWYVLYIHDVLNMADQPQITWLQEIITYFGLEDSSYHYWVEEVRDILTPLDHQINAPILTITDSFNVKDRPETNHELIEDTLQVDSSYIFSGHELIAETLYPDDYAGMGVLELILDTFNFEEDHFDGFFVGFFNQQFSIVEEVLTQHWRHEWFMGVCIASWQIEPVEQEGNDGDKTGKYISQFGGL